MKLSIPKPKPRSYRHVFFKGNIIQNGTGNVTVHYSGNLYPKCDSIKNFSEMYDPNQDLLIMCHDCATRKYKNFIKV